MKSNALSQPYFSAYPLKSVPASAGTEVSTLHITTGGKQRRFNSRLFFMPMVDPYREDEMQMAPGGEISTSENIEVFDTEWYNHYE